MCRRLAVWCGVFVVLIALGMQVASRTGQAGAAPAKGGMLRVGNPRNPTTLDPHYGRSGHEFFILHNIYDTLVGVNAKGNLVPRLATSWENPEPTVWIFKLRKDVKFHDGMPFDAKAVKWNYDRIMDPQAKTIVRDLDFLKSVEVVDDYTVRIITKVSAASLLGLLPERGGMMVSPTAAKKFGADFGRNPVGTGPFMFVEWVQDDHVTLKRFDGYWDQPPRLDGVIYRIIPDETVAMVNLRSGNLDFIYDVSPKNITAIKADRNLVFMERPGFDWYQIYLNTKVPPFDDRRVRLALQYAVNREAMLRGVFFGHGQVAAGPISPSSWAYDPSLDPFPFDRDKAKQLLAEAGYPNGFSFTLLVGNSPFYVQNATVFQAQLAKIEVQAKIEIVETVRMLQLMQDVSYQAVSSMWVGGVEPDGWLYSLYHSKGAWNKGRNQVRQVEELLERARSASSLDERRRLYQQAQRMIREQALDVWLYWRFNTAAMSKKVKGFEMYPDGKTRFQRVWLER